MKKSPNPIDVHVGGRVRLRRMLIGMSQERLGELLGLTFQQVQKYEKGANRIGASRLFQISRILNVPVQFFFDDVPETPDRGRNAEGFAEADQTPLIMNFVSSAEGLELNRAFTAIADPNVRKRIIDLVRSLGEERVEEDTLRAGP
ncbi:MAG: helix-turn-helix transcriptional regulator [Alphaproteobacteria bacterium]|nr:helix-turn-helix transcriptional regulator [Alphaproteobacteria bacterium]